MTERENVVYSRYVKKKNRFAQYNNEETDVFNLFLYILSLFMRKVNSSNHYIKKNREFFVKITYLY